MVTKNLLIRGGADFSSMQKSLKQANKNISVFKGVATKAFAAISAAVAAIGIKKSLDAIDYQIMQETKLAVIMRQRMGATEQMIQSVKNLASAQQSLGIIDAEVQLAGAQQLATFLRTSNALETLIPAMNNLAAQQKGVNATGEDLVGIANMIGKVLDGNVGALKRVGITFSDADQRMLEFGNEAERAATLARVIENNVGQMNSALANTSTGRVKQLANSFGDIEEEIGRLILPLRDVIVPLLQRMVSVATRAVQSMQSAFSGLATFIHTLFGTKPPTQMASGAVQSAEAIGDAYEEAGEKAKGSLAGFDEINSLAQPSGGAGASAPTVPEMATGGLFQGLGEKTSEVSQKMQEMAEKVKASFKSMTDFIVTNKDIILAALTGLAAGIATFLVISNWALIVTTIVKGFAAIRTAIMLTAAWFAALSWPVILISAAVAALVAGFVYFYKTNETFRGVVDSVLNAIAVAAQFLWKQVLVPLGKFLIEVFKVAWDGIVTVAQFLWKNVLVPFGKYLEWLWKNVFVPLGKSLAEMLKPTIEALSAVFMFLWKNALVPLGKFIFEVFIGYWKGLFDIISLLFNNVLKPIAGFLVSTLAPKFKEAFEIIKGVLSGMKTAYIGLMNFITGVFTKDWEKAWNGVKDIFGGVFRSLYALVKNPLNDIIDLVNFLIRGLNKIKIDVPDWVPGLGGESMGINIPQIPKLAQGGIVGANSPMLAMVGDNRTQREAIAPVDDLMGMISSAVLAAMNAQGSRSGDIVLNIDGVSFARVTNPYQAKESTRIGPSMITVS